MTTNDDIDQLNLRIREQAPDALELLAGLPSPCAVDSAAQSPFNLAIEVNNTAVIKALLDDKDAREFAPAVHAKNTVQHMRFLLEMDENSELDDAEQRAAEQADAPAYWQRTPLLQACRFQNREVIAELIKRGAKPGAKDLLKLTPLELCIKVGGMELAEYFVDTCTAAKKSFPVTDLMLETFCKSEGLYKKVVKTGRPTAKAKGFIFNFACANLDRPAIEEMLEDGFDLKPAFNGYTNPIQELLTSSLVWLHRADGWEERAAAFANAKGHPDALVIKVSNDPGPDDMTYGQVVAHHAKLNASVRREEANTKFMSADEKRERLSLLNQLLALDMDFAPLVAKLHFPMIDDIVACNEAELLEALLEANIDLSPADGSRAISSAIEYGCFDVIPLLEKCGHKARNVAQVSAKRMKQYREWQKVQPGS